jgi:outer membrane beta-barrel protein
MKSFSAVLALPVVLISIISASQLSYADDTSPPGSGDTSAKLPIDKVKERYWGKGRDTELRVVQNRLYSKAQKFELGVFGGFVSTDPFLSVKNYGASLGYHFNDYIAVAALFWKDSVSNSAAVAALQQDSNNTNTADTNYPSTFVGAEVDYTPLYGKLSLVGKQIVYFDTHVDGGLGTTSTQTGSDLTEFIGLGEEFYLSQWSSFRIDYRLTHYTENVPTKTIGSNAPGAIVASRTNWSDVVTLGFTFFSSLTD